MLYGATPHGLSERKGRGKGGRSELNTQCFPPLKSTLFLQCIMYINEPKSYFCSAGLGLHGHICECVREGMAPRAWRVQGMGIGSKAWQLKVLGLGEEVLVYLYTKVCCCAVSCLKMF